MSELSAAIAQDFARLLTNALSTDKEPHELKGLVFKRSSELASEDTILIVEEIQMKLMALLGEAEMRALADDDWRANLKEQLSALL